MLVEYLNNTSVTVMATKHCTVATDGDDRIWGTYDGVPLDYLRGSYSGVLCTLYTSCGHNVYSVEINNAHNVGGCNY